MRLRRRKLLICWAALQAGSSLLTYALLLLLLLSHQSPSALAGIVPPPWSDPAKNPCASMAGGWQLLYWTPLKKCFKIFTLGYPCPDTMELSPTPVSAKRKDVPAAECRCPPGTALSALTNACHKLYERGPCPRGEYFQPMPEQAKRCVGNAAGITLSLPNPFQSGQSLGQLSASAAVQRGHALLAQRWQMLCTAHQGSLQQGQVAVAQCR